MLAESHRKLLWVTAMLLVVGFSVAACSNEKPLIRIHNIDTDSFYLNNAIFRIISEDGYGYLVEDVVETTPEMQDRLPKGEIDLNLEGWQQNIADWYDAETANGNIKNLGMTYEGGPQFFVIPQWVADEFGIRTIADMKDHWDLFRDPDDPSKGVFYDCLIGWQCREINAVKLGAYGLTGYYNSVSPGTADALKATLARHQEIRQPVFAYYWAPTDLIGAYDWHILEEPAYSDECWDAVNAARADESLRPIDGACAYETLPIDKLAHAGLESKAPEIFAMLKKMVIGLEPLSETLAWVAKNEVDDWELAATYYLGTYESRWQQWVTPKAFDKVKSALAENSVELP